MCHLAAIFEPPALQKHVWHEDLQRCRLSAVETVQLLQNDEPSFNPNIDFWSTEQVENILNHGHRTSCVLWHGISGPLIKPTSDISEEDESALAPDTSKVSANLFKTLVKRQREERLDVLVIIMRRGAEYQASLCSSIAHNVIWVSVGDVDRSTEQALLDNMLEFLLEQLSRPGGVAGSTLAVGFQQLIDNGVIPAPALCGIVASSSQPARLPQLDCTSGPTSVIDHISDVNLVRVPSLHSASFHLHVRFPLSSHVAPRCPLTASLTRLPAPLGQHLLSCSQSDGTGSPRAIPTQSPQHRML